MAQNIAKLIHKPSWSEFGDFGSFFTSIEYDLSVYGVAKVLLYLLEGII